MTCYLVDTNVVSAGAPGRQAHTPAVLHWMEANAASLFVSVVTVAEIQAGIAKARREGARRKASLLADWLDTVLHLYGDRILPIDVAISRQAGELSDFARGCGEAPGFADIAIAATARVRGLILLTRNLRHFRPLGIDARDPFSDVLV